MNVSTTVSGPNRCELMRQALLGMALVVGSASDPAADEARRDVAILLVKRESPPIGTARLDDAATKSGEPLGASTAAPEKAPMDARDRVAGHERSVWVERTLAALAEERVRASPAVVPLLDAAEMLVPHFSPLPAAVRPQLVLDDDGQPSFEAFRGDFYFDLTIDSLHALSWYAVVRGRKFHGEDIDFKGRRFPEGLRDVFTA